MGNTVIDSRGGPNPLAAALQYWIGSQEQKKEAQRQAEAMRQQQDQSERERRLRIAQTEIQQVHPSQRSAYLASLTPDVRAYFTDPSTLPAPQLTPNEQAESLYGQRKLEAVQGWTPSPFSTEYMNMEGVLGRNPNAQWTNAARDQAFMKPEDFANYAKEGFIAPSDVEKNRAAAAKDKADAAFTSGPRTSTEYAQGTKYGAETGKIKEETITERELRDPNSPASRAKSNAGGRKTSAETAVSDINKTLSRLSKQEAELITEVTGERAGLQGETSPFLRKKEAELAQTRTLIRENIARRNKITTAATKAGVQTTSEVKPQDYPPEVEARISKAVAAGFARSDAIKRLIDSGVIRE